MGATDVASKGYPKSQQKKDWQIYKYCGGSGGGDCVLVQNKTQVRFGVELNPFITSNDSLLLRNPDFFGIALYADGGPAFFCDHSASGSPQQWYLGFSNDGVMTDAEVIAQGLVQSGEPPFDIEISKNKLPQPIDADWSGILYIHIAWANPLWVSNQLLIDDEQYLRIVKHNYQVRQ